MAILPISATVVLLLSFLAAGVMGQKRRGDFFLAGRKSGFLRVGTSLLATCLGGSAVFGVATRAYERGWSAFWWLAAGGIGLALLGLAWSSVIRHNPETRTLPGWLGDTYGNAPRLTAALLIAVMWVGVIAAQLVAAGSVIGSLTSIPLSVGILIVAIFTVSYVVIGGQDSVLRTDIIQLAMLSGALVLTVVFLFLKIPSSDIALAMPQAVDFSLPPYQLTALIIVVGGMYIVGPDMCSRVLVAKDDRSARLGALTAAVGLVIISLVITFLGVAVTSAGIPAPEQPSRALPSLVQHVLPSTFALVVNLGFLAALLSSADTCLLTAGSVLELDFLATIRKHSRGEAMYTRIILPMVMLPAVLLAVFNPRIIGNIMLSYSVFAGGLLCPLILLRFPNIAGRIRRPVLWSAILAGGVIPPFLILSDVVTIEDFTLRMATAGTVGVIICLAIIIGGTAITKIYQDGKKA